MENARTQLNDWLAREGRKQTWLAAQIGVQPEAISRWLSGTIPQPGHRDRIAVITGVPAKDWAATPQRDGGDE